ncbi:glycoside hydrolase [Muricauda sp. 2012CJ35-5]|uniref:Glycoside hydrolase n=1 Tax=Flagellimonas spongiicola TaxID=2942208 RepID=A0ABT0PUA0_9FLAO|nr:sialidase family protein [Allomuricauda spongiicola]MCL6274962.1 glycoside hydrolase [Allomuricauda spongiicola]
MKGIMLESIFFNTIVGRYVNWPFLGLTFLFGFPLFGQQAQKVLFAPNTISTENVEYATTFSPDGTIIYFARSFQAWGSGEMKSTIYRSEHKDTHWTEPKIAEFSGTFNDSDPHLTPDGNHMYFISSRPIDGFPSSSNIWVISKSDNGSWGVAKPLPYPINSDASEYSPTTDRSGNLYFASTRNGGMGQGDLYFTKQEDGQLLSPTNIGKPINTSKGEWNVEVNDNGNILLFEASERSENVSGYGDLYISFKKGVSWSKPQNIKELNTSGSDLYPVLREATKELFFTSSDSLPSKDTNIYSIDISQIIKDYRRKAIN